MRRPSKSLDHNFCHDYRLGSGSRRSRPSNGFEAYLMAARSEREISAIFGSAIGATGGAMVGSLFGLIGTAAGGVPWSHSRSDHWTR
jgi:hypothetical protein